MARTTVTELIIQRLDKIDDVLRDHGKKLEVIAIQTTKTNGRVTVLEDRNKSVAQAEEKKEINFRYWFDWASRYVLPFVIAAGLGFAAAYYGAGG